MGLSAAEFARSSRGVLPSPVCSRNRSHVYTHSLTHTRTHTHTNTHTHTHTHTHTLTHKHINIHDIYVHTGDDDIGSKNRIIH